MLVKILDFISDAVAVILLVFIAVGVLVFLVEAWQNSRGAFWGTLIVLLIVFSLIWSFVSPSRR